MGELADELYGNIFDDLDNYEVAAAEAEGRPAADTHAEVQCVCLRQSPKALLVDIAGRTRWVPKSQITGGDISQPGDKGTLWISTWLARQWADENPEDTAAKELENDRVTVAGCVCLRESDKAVQVRLPDEREEWFPRSQLRPGNEIEHDGDSGTLSVSKWIAGQKKVVG